MLKRLIRGLKNPYRVFYAWRDKLFKYFNLESFLDDAFIYYPSLSSKMRIFLIRSKYDYGDKKRGLSYEENNFLNTMVNSQYDVFAFDSLFLKRKYGKKRMNQFLIEAVYRVSPQILFFVLYNDEIETSSLLEIKDNIKIKTFNWFCDDHWRFNEFSKYYARYFSYVVTTDKNSVKKYKEIGINNVILSQWGCNNFLYKKLSLPYKYEVSFVGQPYGERYTIIKKLKKAGIKIETFGYGWPKGKVSTYEMVKIFNQSKINLNLSLSSNEKVNQVKARDFEIPGCGGFMITGNAELLNDYFSIGKEVICYSNINDLIEKIKYYLNHEQEREQIKENGYLKVINEHLYTHRFSQIFNIISQDNITPTKNII